MERINKTTYLKPRIIISALIWGVGSVMIGKSVVALIEFLEMIMDTLLDLILYLIIGPAKIIEMMPIELSFYVSLVVASLFAWIVMPFVIELFNTLLKIMGIKFRF